MFDKIKKLFKKTLRTKREKDYSFSADRDWAITFFIFLTLNLAIFLYLVSFYLGILKKEDSKEAPLPAETEFIDEKLLEEVIEIYSAREKQLDNLWLTAPETRDPSL